MTILGKIKNRLGIYYSEAGKDAEIQGMVDGAINYFKGAGWDFSTSLLTLSEAEERLEGINHDLKDEENEETIEELKTLKKQAEETIRTAEEELSLPIEAIVLYCKMAQPTSAFQITNHPVLTSMIAQGRASNGTI